ncbi:MAG TPA: hypothetical protein VHD55_03175 [Candidatus Paceibacterota bacterium]|nr:hypothetical protein [Candidatus Paceibacterota bacterium]
MSKDSKNKYQRVVYELLHEKPVAYNAGLSKALGSVKAGVLIGQLLYWHGKGHDPNWTYKTIEEMYEETGLSRREQETAIAICKQKGILEVIRKGIPPRRYFKIDVEKVISLLSQLNKSAKLNCTVGEELTAPIRQHNSESTAQNTSDNLAVHASSGLPAAFGKGHE